MKRIQTRNIITAGIAAFFGAIFLTSCASTKMIQKSNPPQGQFQTVNGTKLHYIDTGANADGLAGPTPIVLIHGASANLLDMKLALGDRLAKQRRIIMVDRPGHGYSQRPENGYLLSEQTRLINGLLNSLGIQEPIVLGQSFGGAVALNYALEYPDALSGLLLVAPVSHSWPGGGVDSYHSAATAPVLGPLFLRTAIPIVKATRGEEIAKGSFKPQGAPENYYEKAGVELVFRPGNFKANSEDLLHLHDQILTQQTRYGAIKVPTKIIAGTDDKSVYPEIHSENLNKEIPNSEYILMQGIGHPLHHFAQDEIEMLIGKIDAQIGSSPTR